MVDLHRYLLPALWLAWALYWWSRSRDVKATVRQEPLHSRALHLVPLAIALALVWAPGIPWIPALQFRVLPDGLAAFFAGAVLTAAGLLFTVWARRYLGRNWSGTVTLKSDHELVTTGPYGLVRHPIYTGLLLAFVGGAVARGTLAGVVSVLLAWLALWRKLRMEERWMREQFGPAYAAYSRRVPALIPFMRPGAGR